MLAVQFSGIAASFLAASFCLISACIRLPPTSKHKVRLTGKVFCVQAVAITKPMNNASHDHLWPGVTTTNPGHTLTSFGG